MIGIGKETSKMDWVTCPMSRADPSFICMVRQEMREMNEGSQVNKNDI